MTALTKRNCLCSFRRFWIIRVEDLTNNMYTVSFLEHSSFMSSNPI